VNRTPYEQVLQHKNVLAIVYNIPTSDAHPYIEGAFSRTAVRLRSEQNGWIFCHGGSTLIAVKIVKPYTWMGKRELRDNYWCSDSARWASKPSYIMDHLRSDCGTAVGGKKKNGIIVEVHPVSRFFQAGDTDQQTLGRFEDAILTGTTVSESNIDNANTRITYWSLDGDELEITYDGRRQINKVNVSYAYPLISAPGVSQAANGNTLTITNGGTRTYNFNTYTAWSISCSGGGC
jgi:hypothetical protein